MLSRSLAIALPTPFLTGCTITLGGGSNIVVDGVELEYDHEEVLEIGSWGDAGFRNDAPFHTPRGSLSGLEYRASASSVRGNRLTSKASDFA